MEIFWKKFTEKIKPDRQFMYKVIFMPVRATIVAVEKQLVLHNMTVCWREQL